MYDFKYEYKFSTNPYQMMKCNVISVWTTVVGYRIVWRPPTSSLFVLGLRNDCDLERDLWWKDVKIVYILLSLMIYFVSFLQTSSTMSILFASTVKHCDDNIQLLSCKLSTKYFRSIIAVLKDSKMQNCKRNISSISRRDDFITTN